MKKNRLSSIFKPRLNANTCLLSTEEQAQRLVSIGQQLRQTREHHSLSLNMVATYTRIRSHLLQALEEGEINQLPEPVYTQGLIRRYGDALGLNGEELATFFLPEPMDNSTGSNRWLLPLPQLRPTHLYLTYILLIICAIQGLAYLIKSPTEADSLLTPVIADSQLEGATQSVQIQASASTHSTSAQSQLVAQSSGNSSHSAPASPPKEKLVEVGITVKDESWVLIEVDGKTEFEGTLPGGTQKSWRAKQELVVVAGNAGGVMITLNNGEAQRLGEPGMVEEVVFKAGNSTAETENPKS